jgi:hypothetical protein
MSIPDKECDVLNPRVAGIIFIIYPGFQLMTFKTECTMPASAFATIAAEHMIKFGKNP